MALVLSKHAPESNLVHDIYIYQPLDPEVDSLRLLKIEDADNYEDPIVCSLTVTKSKSVLCTVQVFF